MIEFGGLTVAGLYLHLKKNESGLDDRMSDLFDNLEAYLFDRLSIEEMEELEKLYTAEDMELSTKI